MIFIDTNILARMIDKSHGHYAAALDATAFLASSEKAVLAISSQVLMEFYAAATRTVNSLVLSPEQALLEIERFKQEYLVLPEHPLILQKWEELVRKYKPVNRRIFDTRHVAFMLSHGIEKILTFNDKDFVGYHEIEVLNPFDVLHLPRS